MAKGGCISYLKHFIQTETDCIIINNDYFLKEPKATKI